MHDYNRNARTYWWLIAVIGLALLARSLYTVIALPVLSIVQITMAMAFVAALAFFPVRIPGTTLSFAAGEVFIFLALLLFGVEAAVVIAAIEGAVGALRSSKRWTSWLGTPAMAAIATALSGYGFLAVRAALEQRALLSGAAMILLVTALAFSYCALTNVLPSLLLALKRNERLGVIALYRARSWMAVAHLCSAALAMNLFYAEVKIDVWLILAALPAVLLLLSAANNLLERTDAENASTTDRRASSSRQSQHA